ncbi:MAG: ArsA-related P-loop ATPase, partial [Bacilli bacterium]
SLYSTNRKIIFTMGKGGVGKTTVAEKIAQGLAEKGANVHLTTTDPAGSNALQHNNPSIRRSKIDPASALHAYTTSVLNEAKNHMRPEDLLLLAEDLSSPCTQEIALFHAFSQCVEQSQNEVLVIDTAPTGHTLLLLEYSEHYHRDILRTQSEVAAHLQQLLPKLRDPAYTEVVIVTLPESTPFYEAERLQLDLKRANIQANWWVVNSSWYATRSNHPVLVGKGKNEVQWLKKIENVAENGYVRIPWQAQQ